MPAVGTPCTVPALAGGSCRTVNPVIDRERLGKRVFRSWVL